MTCCVLVLVSCYLCDTVSIKYYLTTAAQSPRLIITVWPGDSCQKVEMKCERSGDDVTHSVLLRNIWRQFPRTCNRKSLAPRPIMWLMKCWLHLTVHSGPFLSDVEYNLFLWSVIISGHKELWCLSLCPAARCPAWNLISQLTKIYCSRLCKRAEMVSRWNLNGVS